VHGGGWHTREYGNPDWSNQSGCIDTKRGHIMLQCSVFLASRCRRQPLPCRDAGFDHDSRVDVQQRRTAQIVRIIFSFSAARLPEGEP
jgi:hypothetical protein